MFFADLNDNDVLAREYHKSGSLKRVAKYDNKNLQDIHYSGNGVVDQKKAYSNAKDIALIVSEFRDILFRCGREKGMLFAN